MTLTNFYFTSRPNEFLAQRWIKALAGVALAILLLLLSACQEPTEAIKTEPTSKAVVESSIPDDSPYAQILYLVRHAEKELDVDNPGLTAAGVARAADLANLLAGEGVNYIHSSNFRRTLATAKPLSEQTGVGIVLYDAGDLEGFAQTLKNKPGVHVVVGHSNTTPELAALLSGNDVKPMPETEYDRLIIVRFYRDGSGVEVRTNRYGAAIE